MDERFNPETYTKQIEEVIDKALRAGMGIEVFNNKLSIWNTVADIKSDVDLEWFSVDESKFE